MSASGPRRGRLGCDSGASNGAGASVATGVIVPARPRARLPGMAVHEWTVAGGLIETDAGVLLVRNVRRGGFEDWSTPGGVIDADDPDGIVVEARFVPPQLCDEQLTSCMPWVREPLTEWLKERWEPHERRGFD